MKPIFWFWLLDAAFFAWWLFASVRNYNSEARDYHRSIGFFLVFLLITLLGWNFFGSPVSP